MVRSDGNFDPFSIGHRRPGEVFPRKGCEGFELSNGSPFPWTYNISATSDKGISCNASSKPKRRHTLAIPNRRVISLGLTFSREWNPRRPSPLPTTVLSHERVSSRSHQVGAQPSFINILRRLENRITTAMAPISFKPQLENPQPPTKYSIVSYPAEGVLLVTLNRPKDLNCINGEFGQELERIWNWLDQEPALTVGIITGTGRAFCAGADLKGRKEHPLKTRMRSIDAKRVI